MRSQERKGNKGSRSRSRLPMIPIDPSLESLYPNEPRKNDVLVGRGRPFQEYIGNRTMLKLIAQHREEYAVTAREKKRGVAEAVFEQILQRGTRFLRRVRTESGKDVWEEVNRNVGFEKVWHSLRSKDHERKIKRQSSSINSNGEIISTSEVASERVRGLLQNILGNLTQATTSTQQLLAIATAQIPSAPHVPSPIGMNPSLLPLVQSFVPPSSAGTAVQQNFQNLGGVQVAPYLMVRGGNFFNPFGTATPVTAPSPSARHEASMMNHQLEACTLACQPASLPRNALPSTSGLQPLNGTNNDHQVIFQAISNLALALQQNPALSSSWERR